MNRRLTARRLLAIGAALSAVLMWAIPTTSASADVPPIPETEPFRAPLCPGTTTNDPAAGDLGVADLTMVFGERLASYNAGHIVPLYDLNGYGRETFPPLCGVRYVEGVGPVSEWMFCTDLFSKVCGDTLPDGTLADGNLDAATPIEPMERLDGNDRITRDQERLVAYLIQAGAPFVGADVDEFWDWGFDQDPLPSTWRSPTAPVSSAALCRRSSGA